MSTDPIVHHTTVVDQQPRAVSLHLPLAILSLAIALFLMTQIRALSGQGKVMRWSRENAEKQQVALKDGEKQLKEAFTQREPAVKQSVELQTKFQSLFSDLLELSKEDEDARKVVEAWKIQRPAPAPGAAATPAGGAAATPAPAASSTPEPKAQ